MKKFLRNIFTNDKNNYLISNLFFVFISTVISLILINSKDISVSGGIILGIFQIFILNTFWLAIEIKFKLDDIAKTKTTTDIIIQQFAEHEFLQKKYAKIDFYFNLNNTQEKTNKFIAFFNSSEAIQLSEEFFN